MKKQYFLDRLHRGKSDIQSLYSYELIPDNFGAYDKISIICHVHGEFKQGASAHLFGSGCPHCGKQRGGANNTITTEEFIRRSRLKFADRFSYSRTIYVRKGVHLTVTCIYHGDINISPEGHLTSKTGCPKCTVERTRYIKGKRLLDTAKQVHGDTYDYSKVDFKANGKTELICNKHGVFLQSLYDHAIKRTKCPKCHLDSQRYCTNDFIAKAREVHGDTYDYSKVDYRTNETMVLIGCFRHGFFKQRAGSHLDGSNCRKCVIEKSRRSKEDFIAKAREVHGDTYDYSKVDYHGNKKSVEIICGIHGSFWQRPNSHTASKNGCLLCQESKGERAVEKFLQKYGIKYVREYRILPYLYRYDFYLPGINILIEFQGIQHFRPVEKFGGDAAFASLRNRDAAKKLLAECSNLHLVEITYQHLGTDRVEHELIRNFKKIYEHWYILGGNIHAFNGSVTLYTGSRGPEYVKCLF